MKESNQKMDFSIGEFYRKERSAPVIADELGISLNRVYRSLRSQNIVRRTASQQNAVRFKNSPLSFDFRDPVDFQDKMLLVAALMLYFGEGAKTWSTVDIANSDLRPLKIFIKFLRKICRINEGKLRFYLYCFSNQNAKGLIDFWAKSLGVNKKQFTKPYIRKVGRQHTRTMPYGVLHVRYNDKRLLEKILSLCSDVMAKLIL